MERGDEGARSATSPRSAGSTRRCGCARCSCVLRRASRGATARSSSRASIAWTERMGLAAWLDRRVEELSKGMAQKVQFLATIVHEPELVVLDEPFAGLDPVNRDVAARRGARPAARRHDDRLLDARDGAGGVALRPHRPHLPRQAAAVRHGGGGARGARDARRRSCGWRAAAGGRRSRACPGVTARLRPAATRPSSRSRPAPTRQRAPARRSSSAGRCARFEVRTPSLHEIFKRVVGARRRRHEPPALDRQARVPRERHARRRS